MNTVFRLEDIGGAIVDRDSDIARLKKAALKRYAGSGPQIENTSDGGFIVWDRDGDLLASANLIPPH